MISEQAARALFQPIQHELCTMIFRAWTEIHESDLHFKSRSRASLMWDETLFHANIAWCDSEHVYHIEVKKSQTAHYWLTPNTFFRIKKGDAHGYTRNYPTQAAWEFHLPQSELFDKANRLEVTYVLTADETSIADIAVVHRQCDAIDFRFSILEAANVEQLPQLEGDLQDDAADTGIAKLKTELDDWDNEETSNDE
jgi:hypothetical protein